MNGVMTNQKMNTTTAFLLILLVTFVGVSCKTDFPKRRQTPTPCDMLISQTFFTGMASRPTEALTGSAFMENTRSLDFSERQKAAVTEILAGNIPGWLREPATITLQNHLGDNLTLIVLADYLSIGNDHDFVRIPLSLPSAKIIAKRFGLLLPTPSLVDAIYGQAQIQVKPLPMHPGPDMRSNAYYLRHNEMINEQTGGKTGVLVAGHKKDVVITRRMEEKPGNVPIYGWHLESGRLIQPLSLVHGGAYEDYSHGLRLVSPSGCLNGQQVQLAELFTDPKWEGILYNEEGIVPEEFSW